MDKSLINNLIYTCISKGYSVTASAAIVGNWIAEGCLNPSNVNLDRTTNGYHEVGALGFTGGTAESYLAWCKDHKKQWDDLPNQAEFALTYTVQTYYPFFLEMGLFRYFTEIQQYLNCYTTLDRFKQADLLDTATISFMVVWWSPTYKQIHSGLVWASRDSGKYELDFDQRLEQEIRDRTKYAREALKIYTEVITMGFSTVQQNDPRWSFYPFGDGGETFASSACGVFACSIILGLTNINDIQGVYMWLKSNGYVTDHSGTYQQGIYKVLTAYGVKTVQTTVSSIGKQVGTLQMAHARERVKNGGTLVFLFGSENAGTGLTNRFTIGGHYAPITNYDQKNDLYYVQDPAGRTTGWHKWSDFEGDVKHIFECEKSWGVPEPPKTEDVKLKIYKTLPQVRVGSHGLEVLLLQEILKSRGIYTGKLDRDFGPLLEKAVKSLQKSQKLTVDGICGVKTWQNLLGGI